MGEDGPAWEAPCRALLPVAWRALEQRATGRPPAATRLAVLGHSASPHLLSVLCMTTSLVSMAASVLLGFSKLFLLGLPGSGMTQKTFSANPFEPGAGDRAAGPALALMGLRGCHGVCPHVAQTPGTAPL